MRAVRRRQRPRECRRSPSTPARIARRRPELACGGEERRSEGRQLRRGGRRLGERRQRVRRAHDGRQRRPGRSASPAQSETTRRSRSMSPRYRASLRARSRPASARARQARAESKMRRSQQRQGDVSREPRRDELETRSSAAAAGSAASGSAIDSLVRDPRAAPNTVAREIEIRQRPLETPRPRSPSDHGRLPATPARQPSVLLRDRDG